MGIRKWEDHRSRERIYLSRQCPDGTRFRRVMLNMTTAKNTDARITEAVAMGTWRKLKKELARGVDVAEPTIREFSEVYLKEYCHARNRRPDFKVQAFTSINRIIGNVRLNEFSRAHAHHFVNVRSKEVSAATVDRGLAVLKNMFSFALDKELVESHPLHRFRLAPEKKTALRILTFKEYRSLVKAVAAEDLVNRCFYSLVG